MINAPDEGYFVRHTTIIRQSFESLSEQLLVGAFEQQGLWIAGIGFRPVDLFIENCRELT